MTPEMLTMDTNRLLGWFNQQIGLLEQAGLASDHIERYRAVLGFAQIGVGAWNGLDEAHELIEQESGDDYWKRAVALIKKGSRPPLEASAN